MTCEELQSGYELYVLGTLEASERAELERHLACGCPTCEAAVARARELLVHLGAAAVEAEPPSDLRARVLAAIAADETQVWKRWQTSAAPPLLFIGSGDGEWEPTRSPGVQVKRLFVDATNDRVTMLVRMSPGSSYPRHRHAGAEECYVLQGDLHLPGMIMHAGDYQRADADSIHGVQSTEHGCLLFIVSSLRDELLA
jgi:putative transcriptional regulator